MCFISKNKKNQIRFFFFFLFLFFLVTEWPLTPNRSALQTCNIRAEAQLQYLHHSPHAYFIKSELSWFTSSLVISSICFWLESKYREYPYEASLSVFGTGPERESHFIELPSAWFTSISLINNGSRESDVCIGFGSMDLWEEVLRIENTWVCVCACVRSCVCMCFSLSSIDSWSRSTTTRSTFHLLRRPASLVILPSVSWTWSHFTFHTARMKCVRCLNLWDSHSSECESNVKRVNVERWWKGNKNRVRQVTPTPQAQASFDSCVCA